ncbi:MAG: hypothetical protein WBO97_16020 [Tepidiformaceae bacterium]
MDLKLATVVDCDDTGCRVRLVHTGQTVRASFSAQVKDRVRIRKDQLVALRDTNGSPEIAWRWFRGVVEAIDHAGVSVRRTDLPPDACRVVTNPGALALGVGDNVYYGHHEDWTVVDRVAGDKPEHPAEVGSRYFAKITEALSE